MLDVCTPYQPIWQLAELLVRHVGSSSCLAARLSGILRTTSTDPVYWTNGTRRLYLRCVDLDGTTPLGGNHDMATKPGVRRRDINNCRRKIPYETFMDAKRSARLVRQLIHELVLPYKCPLPGRNHYHLGHPSKLNGLSWNDYRSGRYA